MKRLLVLALVLGASLTASFAQSAQIGHLNFQELMLDLPERAEAEQALQGFADEYEQQLNQMKTDYDAKVEKLNADGNALPQAILEVRVNEIRQLEQSIVQLETQAQQDLAQQEVQLLQPMIKRCQEAIANVAKANGFAYILDTSSGAVLYEGGTDVTGMVRKELGLPEVADTGE